MRVVGYSWAGGQEDEDTFEPDETTKAIRLYLKKRKWDGPIQLEDPTEALLDFHLRTAGKDVVGMLQPGDVLVVPDQSFLFSTASQGLLFLRHMRNRQISVHCINHGSDIVQGKLFEIFVLILSPLAVIEPRLPGERARALKRKARDEGRYLGGNAPVGYRLSPDGMLIPDGTQKKLTRQILRLKAKGLSLRMIAAELQKLDVRISHVSVSRILKSVGYVSKRASLARRVQLASGKHD